MTNDSAILLVDDDADTREYLSNWLVDQGFGVKTAASGDEALSFLYADEACDVLVADIVMPGMSGIELAERSREARPGVPMVLMTGHPEGFATASRSGAIVMPKSVVELRLPSVLQELLGTPRSQAPLGR